MEPQGPFSRRESARLVSVLTRIFGVENLALAEEVVQETLASAFEAWSYSGVPEHYSALLTTAAKNRAIDVFRRQKRARKFAPELTRFIESEWTLRPAVDDLFQPEALKDDELRMMFSCCHPRLHEDATPQGEALSSSACARPPRYRRKEPLGVCPGSGHGG